MATEQNGISRTYTVPSDYSTYQYFQMKHDTTKGRVVICAAAADFPVGTLQNEPAAAGRAAEVMIIGWSKVQVEATTDIAVADKLGPHTDGRLIKKSVADNDVVNAIAEEAATSATGDIITAMIFPASWVTVA